MEVPLIEWKTSGREGEELIDLKDLIEKAIRTYKIDGVCTGVLFSEYQKKRIDKICKQLMIRHYAPLWHVDQEKELREMLKEGFEIVFTTVAAEGLDDSWLGRIITENDVDKLVELSKRKRINISGEGGEYESLVLNAPIFKERIVVLKWVKKNNRLIIKEATLSEKAKNP